MTIINYVYNVQCICDNVYVENDLHIFTGV